jgi:RNA-binding protein YlmH
LRTFFGREKRRFPARFRRAFPKARFIHAAEQRLQAASERADAIVAKAYALSREDSAALFEKEKVFVNAAPARVARWTLRAGDTVSVRGYGRFD